MTYPIPPRCPRCDSTHPGTPNRVAGPGIYTCRHAWHMPTPERDAVAYAEAVDNLFAAEIPLPPEVLECNALRESAELNRGLYQ